MGENGLRRWWVSVFKVLQRGCNVPLIPRHPDPNGSTYVAIIPPSPFDFVCHFEGGWEAKEKSPDSPWDWNLSLEMVTNYRDNLFGSVSLLGLKLIPGTSRRFLVAKAKLIVTQPRKEREREVLEEISRMTICTTGERNPADMEVVSSRSIILMAPAQWPNVRAHVDRAYLF
jgi:hypothetical protein